MVRGPIEDQVPLVYTRVMKAWTLGLALATLSVIGCGHAITEKDVVGTWKPNPELASKLSQADANLVMTMTADHNYELVTPTQQGLTGTWVLAGTLLSLQPVNLFTPNPAGGKRIEVPVGQALQQMQSRGASPSALDSFKKASQPINYSISDDGRKMSNSVNGPADWVKEG